MGGGVGMKARVGGRCLRKKYTSVIQCCSREIFFRAKNVFLLMMIADSPLLGQSTSGLNFYDDSGCSPLTD